MLGRAILLNRNGRATQPLPERNDERLDVSQPAMLYPGLLKNNSKGAAVRRLQHRLLQLGYERLGPRRKALTIDGVFGPLTEEAVCEFQMRNTDFQGFPLVVDGKVGPLTWEALFETRGSEFVLTKPRDTTSARFMFATLTVARDQVGIREVPRDSNRGPEVEQYLASVGLGPGNSWCAAFVYWCAREAAGRLGREPTPLVRTAWTPSLWSWARKRGSHLSPDDVLERGVKLDPGCLFLLHGQVNGRVRVKHAGFVAGGAGGWIETIEGNTNKRGGREGGGVYRLRRKITSIYRFVNYG